MKPAAKVEAPKRSHLHLRHLCDGYRALVSGLEVDAAEADQHHGPCCQLRNRRSTGTNLRERTHRPAARRERRLVCKVDVGIKTLSAQEAEVTGQRPDRTNRTEP